MLENEPVNECFEEFHASSDKQVVTNIVTYAKILSPKSVSKLEESGIEEMLNTDKNAPHVRSLGHGENAEMLLNIDKHMDSSSDDDDDDMVNTGEKNPHKIYCENV